MAPSAGCPRGRWAFLQKACDIASKGVIEDRKGNYDEALRLYEESDPYFQHALEHEAKLDEVKDCIRNKWKLYKERVEELKSYPHKKRSL